MAIAPGFRLGPYEIRSLLGAGGMGEVYRAYDGELGRDVAIKVLPAEVAEDPDRLARLRREAQILASLNHPNIATIHGVVDAPGVRGLVLELVDGPTLAERLQAGPLPLDEALPIAKQVSDALEAAHENGIVHRDLKPANIKLRPDGTAKVLDFGLARALGRDAERTAASQVATMTADATQAGAIVGTVAYMSPEQARGRPVDRRTDLWAFGCVLYEMLTGSRAFAGSTLSDILVATLEREPDWSRLPAETPPGVRRLLRRCLEKDPRQRLRDAGDARLDLDEALGSAGDAVANGQTQSPRLRWMLAAAGVLFALGAGVLVGRLSTGGQPPGAITRLTLTLPASQLLDTGGGTAPLALSPDGRRLVYVAAGEAARTQLYVRSLEAFEARALVGTEGARYPFFSPDGEWVAFFAGGQLKRVSLAGGAPVPVCPVPSLGRGGAWGPDGTIVFAAGAAGLMRVAAAGGRPEAVPGTGIDGQGVSWPQFLPDGRSLLLTVQRGGDADALGVLSLDTGQWREVGPGSQAQYVPTGHLVYHAPHVREGELHAVAFDVEQASLRGEPISVLDGVFRAPNGGAAYFAVSRTGTLIFAPGGLAHALVRVDRNGRRTPLSDDRRGFRFPRVSPDGRRIAVTIDPRPSQIWIYDLARRTRFPLTAGGHNIAAVWTADGTRLVYTTEGDLYWRAADGSAPAEPLVQQEHAEYGHSWSRDGRLLFFDYDAPGNFDVWVMPPGGPPAPLVAGPAQESHAVLSPDGRWLAYGSDESGRVEIYVRPFPDVSAGKWAISTEGGHSPLWSPDGRELFYMNGSAVIAVPVETRQGDFAAGAPVMLFSGPFDATQSRNYDVLPDGAHFVMVEADPDTRPTRVQVVLDWFEELARGMPR